MKENQGTIHLLEQKARDNDEIGREKEKQMLDHIKLLEAEVTEATKNS